MSNNKILGNIGERLAVWHLKLHFYKIVQQNYSNPMGEVDIIALKGDTIVFIEVKARKGAGYGTPAEAVTYNKRKRIIRMARAYLANYPDCAARFDIIEVHINGLKIKINHIKNAFTEE